jgi:site-specific DNA recombinase
MKTAAGYCRVSTKDQFETGTSIADQKARIQTECKNKNWQLHKIYEDGGLSGTIEERPAVVELLKDAKAKSFDTVVFTKIDRASRELRLLLNFCHELEKLGVKLYSIDDTSINDPVNGQLSLHILGAIATHEANRIKERTSAGRKIKWTSGQAFIGQPPYGYRWRKEKSRIEVEPEEAKVYEKIVSLYVDSGYSLIDIANLLDAEGIAPPSKRWGKKSKSRWHAQAIRNILINTAYKGFSYYNQYVYQTDPRTGRCKQTKTQKPPDQWVKVEYPVLITEDRWRAIQLRREQQKIKPKKHFINYKDHFLASGLVFCGECGGKLRRLANEQKNGKASLSYVCGNKSIGKKTLQYLRRDRCSSKYWQAGKVDDRVFTEIVKVLSSPGHYAKAWLKNQNVEELQEKITQLKNKKQMLATAVARNSKLFTHAGDIDLAKVYEKQLKADEREFKTIKAKLKKAEYELSLKSDRIDRLKAFEKAVSGNKNGSVQVEARKAFANHLWNLPFKEKQRVLQAVVQPEMGGKITLRNVMLSDSVDEPVKNDKPVNDKDPIIELDFTIDINRLEKLISSLNFNERSNQSSYHHLLF